MKNDSLLTIVCSQEEDIGQLAYTVVFRILSTSRT